MHGRCHRRGRKYPGTTVPQLQDCLPSSRRHVHVHRRGMSNSEVANRVPVAQIEGHSCFLEEVLFRQVGRIYISGWSIIRIFASGRRKFKIIATDTSERGTLGALIKGRAKMLSSSCDFAISGRPSIGSDYNANAFGV